MTDDLPVLTQCMIDVNSGTYNPSVAAVIGSGGKVEATVDPATGQPIKILVADSTVVDPKATLTLDDASTIQLGKGSGEVSSAETKPAADGVAAVVAAIETAATDAVAATVAATTDAAAAAKTAATDAAASAIDAVATATTAAKDATATATTAAKDATTAAKTAATDATAAATNAVEGAAAATTDAVEDVADAAINLEAKAMNLGDNKPTTQEGGYLDFIGLGSLF